MSNVEPGVAATLGVDGPVEAADKIFLSSSYFWMTFARNSERLKGFKMFLLCFSCFAVKGNWYA